MRIGAKRELSDLLQAITDDLDIPAHMYEDAVVKYTEVGGWLAREDSELARYEPDIYPQGSFRLGTMVRPVEQSADYDIDLVCQLKIDKESTTQAELKERVGTRLRAHADIKKITKESRRCWVLEYPSEFHMDVLPVIPNVDRPPNGILLTDTELRRWQFSNPIAYAEWFKERMKVVLLEKRSAYAERHEMSIEEVPEYVVKTPLQRVVQILKRHRDIYFRNGPDVRPISMIITTLAAQSYRNQSVVDDALMEVVASLDNHVERRDGGRWWVQNPVDEGENFADRWNEYPERREAFFNWLERVRHDFSSAREQRSLIESASALSPALGEDTVARAATSLGVPFSGRLTRAVAATSLDVPPLGDTRHWIAPVWDVRETYKVTVKATVYPGSKTSKATWPMGSKPVPRNCWLRFQATTNAPEPYDVRWQVVNTGKEAKDAGCLRGNLFEASNGVPKTIRWEPTAYRGTHWIEAFVLRDLEGKKVCVARSGPVKVRIRG